MRAMCSITRAPILSRRSDRRELATGERADLRDRGAHAMHQPERGGMQDKPHVIGRGAVTRHAIRRQLRLVQLDQFSVCPPRAVKPPIDEDAALDRAAIAASQKAASAKASDAAPPWLGGMSDRELQDYTRRNFGF
jgi:hypothetical protein